MTIGEIICIIIGVIAILLLIVAIFIITRRKSGVNGNEEQFEDVKSELISNAERNANQLKEVMRETNSQLSNMLYKSIQSMDDRIARDLNAIREGVQHNLGNLAKENAQGNKDMRDVLDNKMQSIQSQVDIKLDKIMSESNTKLDEMRRIVDEKLQETLNTRIAEAFKVINDQMASLNKNIGEVQTLSSNVDSLGKIMSGVKSRGTWGEVSLNSLLEEILTPDQYRQQAEIGKNNKVDFAVRMPGQDGGELLLPIDSKFPLDRYEHVMAAQETSDIALIKSSRKELIASIEQQARSIRDKYISPPKTTDFAIMYLPTEGLYAEVVKEPGLIVSLQSKQRVIVCGPTTVAALLNSLQVGFKTLKIQKNTSEIYKVLGEFRKDFATFNDILEKTRNKAQDIVNSTEKGLDRTRIIDKKLNKLDKYDVETLEHNEIG